MSLISSHVAPCWQSLLPHNFFLSLHLQTQHMQIVSEHKNTSLCCHCTWKHNTQKLSANTQTHRNCQRTHKHNCILAFGSLFQGKVTQLFPYCSFYSYSLLLPISSLLPPLLPISSPLHVSLSAAPSLHVSLSVAPSLHISLSAAPPCLLISSPLPPCLSISSPLPPHLPISIPLPPHLPISSPLLPSSAILLLALYTFLPPQMSSSSFPVLRCFFVSDLIIMFPASIPLKQPTYFFHLSIFHPIKQNCIQEMLFLPSSVNDSNATHMLMSTNKSDTNLFPV